MKRWEKIGGVVLGLALFGGLFYLIYDSFIAAPGTKEEAATEGLEEPGETALPEEETAAPGEETPAEGETAAPPETVTGLK